MIRFSSVELPIYAFHPLAENSATSTPVIQFYFHPDVNPHCR